MLENLQSLADLPKLIHQTGARLTASQLTLDGEIVALDERGLPSFQLLQNRSRRSRIVFYSFDVLHMEGSDLTSQTLDQRRAILEKIVSNSDWLISKDLPVRAAEVVAAVRDVG